MNFDRIRRPIIPGLIFAGMLCAIAFGTLRGFPVFDDACLYLLGNEKDQVKIAEAKSNRPIYGLLLQQFVDTFALNETAYVILNLVFWILLAWQTYRLSTRLFESQYSAVLSALMVLSPIFVKTHFSTITILIPGNLPVSICLGVLLLSLREKTQQKPILLVLIGVLSLAAAVLSEYGVATAAASITLLLVLKRLRPAIAILAGTIVGFFIFQRIGDFSLNNQSRVASKQLETFLNQPIQAIFDLIVNLWTSLLSSYGSAAAAIRLENDTRSTIVSVIAGIFAAILIKKWFHQSDENSAEPRKLLGFLLATVAGLLPVVYANEFPASGYLYETRFFIPILPFATIATVRGTLNIVDQRFRPWVAALFIFIAVCTVCNSAFDTWREQSRMESVGEVVKPYVLESEGITVVGVPDTGGLDGADITPKVTKKWPRALERRVWILPLNHATELFGSRTECRNTTWMELEPRFWSRRRGTVSHLLYMPSFWESSPIQPSSERIQPYCVERVTE